MPPDRKGRYLKPGTRASVPGVFMSVHVDTVEARGAYGPDTSDRRFGRAWVCVSYRRNGKWSAVETHACNTGSAVIECVRGLAVAGRTNWVIAEGAAHVLTLIGWWQYVDRMGVGWKGHEPLRRPSVLAHPDASPIVIDSLVVRGAPDIVGYTQGGYRYRWVGTANYWPDGLPANAPRAPVGAGDTASGRGSERAADARGAVRARTVLTAATALCDWWSRHALTPFAPTVGALALGMLRSYAPPRVLCSHSDPDVHRLERDAAFGGRASVWFVGNVGAGPDYADVRFTPEGERRVAEIEGPVTHLDVRSMYPTLLRQEAYPVKLLYYREGVPVKEVVETARAYGVVASVSMVARAPEYPFRHAGRIVYPVGHITTSLTGPEILKAASDSQILKVHRMAVYKLGRPFVRWGEKLLELRRDARAGGRDADERFAKLLANSLAGKLAQRKGQWERSAKDDSPGAWGEQYSIDLDAGTTTRTRYLSGFAWRWGDDESGAGPHTAAFAYLCAYGRLQMRRIRELLPARTVVSQDTDGLWTVCSAADILTRLGQLAGEGPGQLCSKGTAHSARFFGPRHYYVDRKWVLAGFHSPSDPDTALRVIDTVATSLWGGRDRRAPDSVRTVTRTSQLRYDQSAGEVGPDGWLVPVYRRPGRFASDAD